MQLQKQDWLRWRWWLAQLQILRESCMGTISEPKSVQLRKQYLPHLRLASLQLLLQSRCLFQSLLRNQSQHRLQSPCSRSAKARPLHSLSYRRLAIETLIDRLTV
jgi:hypothetical protein